MRWKWRAREENRFPNLMTIIDDNTWLANQFLKHSFDKRSRFCKNYSHTFEIRQNERVAGAWRREGIEKGWWQPWLMGLVHSALALKILVWNLEILQFFAVFFLLVSMAPHSLNARATFLLGSLPFLNMVCWRYNDALHGIRRHFDVKAF